MRHRLKFRKQPSLIQFLLLFPIMGLLDLKNDLKYDTLDGFTIGWILYLFLTAFWFLIVGGIIYVIYTRHIALLTPVAIPLGIAFLLVGLPRVIYKLFNRKPRK